jgi:hemerythrin
MMESDYEWINDYSIGIEEIDIQHKRILLLIKKIYILTGQSIDHARRVEMLEELIRYMRFHFSSEEILMGVYQYPKISEQKSQHWQLLADLENKYTEIKSNRGEVVQLLFLMLNWFVDHDNKYDKEFGEFVRAIREK